MNKDELKIKQRLRNVLEVGSLQMFEFIKLMNIRFTDEIDSAAISCSSRPELLLNKEFMEKYCKTDEHLFMLIQHELYHVILGHTKLFTRHTVIDNIAFDAIINAMLCRMHPKKEFVSFFENINPSNSFPGALLRPMGSNCPKELIPLLRILYETNTGTYFDVYQQIAKNLSNFEGLSFVLIGNHKENSEINNPFIKKIVEKVVEKWPKQFTITGRDLGSESKYEIARLIDPDVVERRKMRKLLLKSGISNCGSSLLKAKNQLSKEECQTFIPSMKDRLVEAKKEMYDSLLYQGYFDTYKVASESNLKTLVYLDVSGSVKEFIGKMLPLLLKPYKRKECELFVFSTEVKEVTYKELLNGKYVTTGGTSINCVFKHYFSLPKKKQTKRILLLTDGYVGEVSSDYVQRINKTNTKVYCGLFGDSIYKDDLKPIAKEIEVFNL